MKLLATLTMSAAVLASTTVFTHAFAQEQTRAEVRQELIQAENNGSRFIADASYEDTDPSNQDQVTREKAQQPGSGEGAGMAGMNQSGRRTAMPDAASSRQQACVGPVSYCNLYFGS
ncbi:DUF4148 domain-containing protein [Paraburkholderia solisilvae]|uniref:DUF4148 domain-containing protein n=1 Tax=Paraburkholderia solisilvae TaxID=624376 RepID=A0A6J5DHF1_9BURK|nr:DUF4148 domain-containing protein [Paraburkholderia solisilvae]CAB3752256.1 hypothetical protein LMG29739_01478 [Paraburkholderia solisilvae]